VSVALQHDKHEAQQHGTSENRQRRPSCGQADFVGGKGIEGASRLAARIACKRSTASIGNCHKAKHRNASESIRAKNKMLTTLVSLLSGRNCNRPQQSSWPAQILPINKF